MRAVLLALALAIPAPPLAAEFVVGIGHVLSSGASGYSDGEGLVLGAAQQRGRWSLSAGALVTNRPKQWRRGERENPVTWRADLMVGRQFGRYEPVAGACWAGWDSDGLDEGKADAGPCAGVVARYGWGVVRLVAAEFEDYGAERDARYSVRSYTLSLWTHVSERVSMLTQFAASGEGWSHSAIGLAWRW